MKNGEVPFWLGFICGASGTGLVLGFLGIGGWIRLIACAVVGMGLGFVVDFVVRMDEKRTPPPGAWPPGPPPQLPPGSPPGGAPPSGNGHPPAGPQP